MYQLDCIPVVRVAVGARSGGEGRGDSEDGPARVCDHAQDVRGPEQALDHDARRHSHHLPRPPATRSASLPLQCTFRFSHIRLL